MAICQYFLKGTCKFGDRCFNEHKRPDNRGTYNQGHGGGQHNRGYGDQRNYQQGRQDFGGGGGGRGNYGGNNDHYNQGYQGQKSHYQDRRDFGDGRGSHGGNHHAGNQRGGNYGRDQYHYVRNSDNSNRYAALSHQPDPEVSNFDQRSQAKPRSNSTSQHLVTMEQRLDRVKKDIQEWDQSGQWPWSCYAAYADDSCYEGLLDISPEEVRVEAYQANAGGNVGSYTQSIQQTTQKYMHRKRELSNMSLASLQQEMARSSQASAGASGGLFGNLTSPVSPFAGNQASLFGTTAPPATTTASNGVFGSSLQSMSTSGPSSSPFSSSMFPATTSSGPFASSSGPFASSSGPFASSSGPFSSSSGTMSSVDASMSLFGSSQDNPTITADSSEPPNSAANRLHTTAPALRCSEQDLKAFKAEYFVLGAIPECPPPPELC